MNNDAENNETLKDALKSYGLKRDIGRIHKEMMQTMTGEQPQRPVRSMFRVVSRIAAAVLLLIIGTGIFVYVTSTPENLFQDKFHPYEESAQRGGPAENNAVKQQFQKGQDFIRNGDAPRAILTFAEILSINARSSEKILNDDAEYYLALSYLKDDQPENALPILEKINGDTSHLYHDQVSDWFLMRVRISAWKNK